MGGSARLRLGAFLHISFCWLQFWSGISQGALGAEPDRDSGCLELDKPRPESVWLQPPDQLPIQWEMKRYIHEFFILIFLQVRIFSSVAQASLELTLSSGWP